MFVLPLWLGGVTIVGTLLLRVLTGLALLCWLGSVVVSGKLTLPLWPAVLFALAYFTLSAISTLQSPYFYGSYQVLLDTLSYLSAFFVAAALADRYGTLFVSALLVLAALLGSYGLAQHVGYGITPQAFPNRLSSSYYNSNHYAGFLDIVTPLCLVLALQVRAWGLRIVLALLTLLLTINLVLSLSWGVLAVGLVALGACIGWLGHRPRLALGLATTAVLVLGIAFYLDFEAKALELYEARSASLQAFVGTSLESRWLIWQGAWQLTLDQPWFGVGPGNFVYTYPLYRADEVDSVATALTHGLVEYAHNDYLHISSERGVLALGSYLGLLVFVLWNGFRRDKAARTPLRLALSAGVLALLIHGIFDGNATIIPATTLLLWIAMGIIIAPSDEDALI